MNAIVVHGSALKSLDAKDIDVIFTGFDGRFGEDEIDRVHRWARARGAGHRGLPTNLPLDVKNAGPGSAWMRDGRPIIYVPQAGDMPAPFEILAGDPDVRLRKYTDLPAQVRAGTARAMMTRPGGVRLCIHDPSASDDFDAYTQGLGALRRALLHAAEDLPELTRLVERGVRQETIEKLSPGSQAGAGSACICMVRLDGLRSVYGDVFVPWAEV